MRKYKKCMKIESGNAIPIESKKIEWFILVLVWNLTKMLFHLHSGLLHFPFSFALQKNKLNDGYVKRLVHFFFVYLRNNILQNTHTYQVHLMKGNCSCSISWEHFFNLIWLEWIDDQYDGCWFGSIFSSFFNTGSHSLNTKANKKKSKYTSLARQAWTIYKWVYARKLDGKR